MFGELSLSERAIASQGVMFFGSETVTSEFTQTTDGVAILSGLLDLSGTSVKQHSRLALLLALQNCR